MTNSWAQGDNADLLAEFYTYPDGPLEDVSGLTISITTLAGATVLAATSSGIVHIATGVYAYSWPIPAAQAVGDYLAVWQATGGITATEIFTVTEAADESESPGSSNPASVWYCTREDVASESDTKHTARDTVRIDRVIESASRSIETLCHRRFYPETLTRTFDWPDRNVSEAWRLWLDANTLISATSISSGGTTIDEDDYFLRPDDGPPYSRVEIDLSSSAAYGGGNTHQRDISITGVWGYRNDEELAGTLAASVTTSTATTIDISGHQAIGVGSILRIGNERLVVTDRAMLDTAVNIAAADSLTAQASDVSITVSTLTNAPAVGEVILIDSERMLVVDIAGTVLTVKRAWDGSVLAAHSANADIYAPRRLTVARGALGTSAATHSSGGTIYVWQPPPLVRQLCIAEAVVQLQQGSAAFAGTVGTGSDTSRSGTRATPGVGLPALRAQVHDAFGRKARKRAV